MFDYTKYRMPIAAEIEADKKYVGYLIGFNQQKGLWILLKEGNIKTFFRDEIKEIKPINNPGFAYKESPRVMSIRAMQSQQWNPDLLPKFELGKSQEFQFSGVGPTKKHLNDLEKQPKGGMHASKGPSADTHWL